MRFQDAKDYFYSKLDVFIKDEIITSEELIRYIEGQQRDNPWENTSGFYELCARFQDIPLNARFYSDKERHLIQSKAQLKDVEAAKDAFWAYLRDRSLTDAEGIIDAVEVMYKLAWDSSDPRILKDAELVREIYRNPVAWKGEPFYGNIPEELWSKIRKYILDVDESVF